MEDVDNFLDALTVDYEALYSENAELTKKVELLIERLEVQKEQEESIKAAIINSQRMCDTIVKEAKQSGDLIMQGAKNRAEKLTEQAEASVQAKQVQFEALKSEVDSFKNELVEAYKTHLRKINEIPSVEFGQIEGSADNQKQISATNEMDPIKAEDAKAHEERLAEEARIAKEAEDAKEAAMLAEEKKAEEAKIAKELEAKKAEEARIAKEEAAKREVLMQERIKNEVAEKLKAEDEQNSSAVSVEKFDVKLYGESDDDNEDDDFDDDAPTGEFDLQPTREFSSDDVKPSQMDDDGNEDDNDDDDDAVDVISQKLASYDDEDYDPLDDTNADVLKKQFSSSLQFGEDYERLSTKPKDKPQKPKGRGLFFR